MELTRMFRLDFNWLLLSLIFSKMYILGVDLPFGATKGVVVV